MKCTILFLICGIFHGYTTAANEAFENTCSEDIIKSWTLADLAEIATHNESCSETAGKIFNDKYAGMEFKVYGLKNDTPFIFYYENRIEFHHLETFINVLQSFGHLVSNLEINFNRVNEKDSEAIGSEVISRSGETLSQLKLVNCDLGAFTKNPSSLQNVEHMTFSGEIKNVPETTNLSQFLPNLKWLSLELAGISDSNLFDEEFSHLKQLSVKFFQSENPVGFKEMLTEKLFKKNPQIESVELVNCDTQFLWTLKESLKPKVLKIQGLVNVHSGNSDENIDTTTEKISFENLDEIQLSFMNDLEFEEFFSFMENPLANIKKLQLKKGVLGAQQLMKLARYSPNLIEASLDCALDASPSDIVIFIKFNGKLDELHLLNATLQDSVRAELDDKWTIKESTSASNEAGFTIQRLSSIDSLETGDSTVPIAGSATDSAQTENGTNAPATTGGAYGLYSPSFFVWISSLLSYIYSLLMKLF